MLEISFHYLIFLIIIYSNGLIFYKLSVEGKNSNLNLNIFEVSILGLIFTAFLAVILNFFFPLNDYLLYINLILSLITLYYFRNEIKISSTLIRVLPKSHLLPLHLSSKIYLSIFFLILKANFSSYLQKPAQKLVLNLE